MVRKIVSAITGAVVARLAWCDPSSPARLFTAGRSREGIRPTRSAVSGFTGLASSSMGTTPSGGAHGIGSPSLPKRTSSSTCRARPSRCRARRWSWSARRRAAGRWSRAPRGTRGCPRAGAGTMACVRAVTTARHCSPFRRCCAAPAAAKRFPSRGTNRTYANEGATPSRSRGKSHWRARRSP